MPHSGQGPCMPEGDKEEEPLGSMSRGAQALRLLCLLGWRASESRCPGPKPVHSAAALTKIGAAILTCVQICQHLHHHCAGQGNIYQPVGGPRLGPLDEPLAPGVVVWSRPGTFTIISGYPRTTVDHPTSHLVRHDCSRQGHPADHRQLTPAQPQTSP